MSPRSVRAKRRGGRRRYGGHHQHLRVHGGAQGGRAQRRRAAALGRGPRWPGSAPGPASGGCAACRPSYIPAIGVLVRSLVSGTEPVLADRADAETVAASGCAHVSLVPTQLAAADHDSGMSAPLAGFRSVLLGGAAAPAGLLRAARAAGVPVVTTYGMTETCGGCVYDGMPLDGVRVAVRDDEDGTGRIWIAGPVLFSGYLPRRATGARDGWFRTGDLGTVEPAGRLTVHGRADDVINTGGFKVVPGEVAEALRSLPGRRRRGGGRTARPGMGRNGSSRSWCRQIRRTAGVGIDASACAAALAALRCSEQGRVVDAIPMLPSRKHDIARLRQELLRREQTEAESVTN